MRFGPSSVVPNAQNRYERGGNRTKHLGERNVAMLRAEGLYWDGVGDETAGVWGAVMGNLRCHIRSLECIL